MDVVVLHRVNNGIFFNLKNLLSSFHFLILIIDIGVADINAYSSTRFIKDFVVFLLGAEVGFLSEIATSNLDLIIKFLFIMS